MVNSKRKKKKDKDDSPPTVTYFHDNFHELLKLLDVCVTDLLSNNEDSVTPRGTDEWQTWSRNGLLKPKNTLLGILKALDIDRTHHSIKEAFQFIMDRVPSLHNYLVVGDTINDDFVTVAVHDSPKRRSSRLQHSTLSTEKQLSSRDNEAVSAPIPEHSGMTATVPLEQPKTGDDSTPTSQEDDLLSFETTLATANTTLQAMKDEYNELKDDMVGLIKTLKETRASFDTLQDQHTKFVASSAQYKKEMNNIVSSGLKHLQEECSKSEKQLRDVGDDTVLQMSTWSASFSKKCQNTLETVQSKIDEMSKDLPSPYLTREDTANPAQYIPIKDTDPQEYLCLRNGVVDNENYYCFDGLYIRVKDFQARTAATSTKLSSPREHYAPSNNFDLTREPNGRESMFGTTYYLGQSPSKASILDQYEFPKGTSYALDAKYFLKPETNTLPTVTCKEEIMPHYKQYVAAAHRFGILITPAHQVTRWGNEEYPPTCPYKPSDFATKNHFDHVYTQSSTALYCKLKKTLDESWPEGWNLVDQEDITCDG